MGTRKRKHLSGNHDQGPKRSKNPFLASHAALGADTSSSQEKGILPAIVQFVESSKSRTSDKQFELCEKIIEFLKQPCQGRFQPTDVAGLVFPWATKQLLLLSSEQTSTLSIKQQECVWNALATSLGLLPPNGVILHSTLSQSVLHKLVPLVAKTASGPLPDSDKDNGRHRNILRAATASLSTLLEYYRPTFDEACQSLLLPLGKEAATEAVLAILRFLRRLQTHGNIKTTFQVIASSPRILLSLCCFWENEKLKPVIQSLVWEGLFHKQHLDGFRGLKMTIATEPSEEKTDKDSKDENGDSPKASSFHCYQETLLTTIQGWREDGSAPVLPLLLRGFIVETKTWQAANARRHKKRRQSKDISTMHFQFFSTLIVPLLEQMNNNRVFSLCALKDCLLVLLDEDVHRPSLEDGQQFLFLQRIAIVLLKSTDLDARERDETLRSLELLLRLDHRLFHDRLVTLLEYCTNSSKGPSVPDSSPVAIELVVTIVGTYSKLRQIDHLFRSYLHTIEQLCKAESQSPHTTMQNVAVLGGYLRESRVSSEMADAVRSLPDVQVELICTALDSWIKANERSGSTPTVIDAAVTLFVLFLRNVRVDKATASDVAALCRQILEGSVSALLGDVKEDFLAPLAQKGLLLCGWAMDLQTRCDFWLGQIGDPDAQVGSAGTRALQMIPNALKSFESGASSSPLYEPVLDELQFLACQRVQQLHSLILEQERAELCPNSAEQKKYKSSADCEKETRHLVAFAYGCAAQQQGSSSRWKFLAQRLASWVPYADRAHIRGFLAWMFSNFEGTQTQPIESIKSDYTASEESKIAKALLLDATFFEIPAVYSQLGLVCLSSASQMVEQAISLISRRVAKDKSVIMDGLNLTAQLTSTDWANAGPQDLVHILRKPRVLFDDTTGAQKEAVKLLEQAVGPLMVLNGLPQLQSSVTDVASCIDSILRLDVVSRGLHKRTSFRHEVLLTFSSALRVAAARLFDTATCSKEGPDLHHNVIGSLISYTYDSTVEILESSSLSLEDAKTAQLATATASLIKSVFRYCASTNRDIGLEMQTCAREAIVGLFKLLPEETSDFQHLALFCLGRSSIDGLLSAYDEGRREFILGVAGLVRRYLWKPMISMVSGGPIQGSNENGLKSEALFLMGEMLKIAVLFPEDRWWDETKVQELEKMLVHDIIPEALDGGPSSKAWHAVNYVVESSTLVGMSNATKRFLIDYLILVSDRNDPLVDSAFCTLAQGMGIPEVNSVVKQLLQGEKENEKVVAPRLRMFQLLLECLDEDQVSGLADAGKEMFDKALDVLSSCDSHDTQRAADIDVAMSLVMDLTKHRTIINLRERDIALVLSHLSGVLGPGGPDGSVSNEVFTSCSRLLCALLQRFPKQLYVCAPSLVCALNSLLMHTLYGNHSELEMMDRGQNFARVCEFLIPHRDIYKKHVLGLVLEFSHALQGDIHPVRKKSVLPGIYSLLEMLSTHETQQLNALMDTSGKTLFRSVYQIFQKLHVYKGQ